MAAAGRRWQRCSSCGCRLMSASGQRPCCPSHGRGHHLPGRSTSIPALWRTAWVRESACWAVAVERWARRGATRRRKGCFDPFVRYLTHLDLEAARLHSSRPCWRLSRGEFHFHREVRVDRAPGLVRARAHTDRDARLGPLPPHPSACGVSSATARRTRARVTSSVRRASRAQDRRSRVLTCPAARRSRRQRAASS